MKVQILTLRTCKEGFQDLLEHGCQYKYREAKPFWRARLFSNGQAKHFDEVHIKNGYQPDSPLAIYEFSAIEGPEVVEGVPCFKIVLWKLKAIYHLPS